MGLRISQGGPVEPIGSLVSRISMTLNSSMNRDEISVFVRIPAALFKKSQGFQWNDFEARAEKEFDDLNGGLCMVGR